MRDIVCEVCAPFFEILTADSGDAAREIVLIEKPDVALCDFRMPGCSGLEALAALKALDIRRPTILMTSEDPSAWTCSYQREAPFDSLLTKPFSKRELLSTFATLIGRAYHDADFQQRLLSS